LNDQLGLELDIELFDRELSAAMAEGLDVDAQDHVDRLRAALAIYRGDYLEDIEAGDWHLEQRDRLRRRWVDGMLALGEALTTRGRYKEAAELYRQLVGREELHEEAYRRLMASLVSAGERQQAIRAYERLATLLRDDLDAEPEPETRAVFERLRGVSSLHR
jgi:DNA-binding SARP family transcriptional activator